MTTDLIGNTLGRLVLSYAIIWIAMWFGLAKLRWRDAFRRTNHWTGLTATSIVFFIGLIAAQANGVPQ